jgi:hypothetical protein
MKKTREQIIQILKSGDFTIYYHDNEAPTLYQKKWDMDEENDRDECETVKKFEIDFDDYGGGGYCPEIVDLLTEALGGVTGSE